ncbi:equilibrative nucleoside transporter 2-like [Hibiscus syriacus]|uniref:Equilibrative nucleoside transporter 2-like n=1 Tax=Hibiscus syriacus TaxID=106335 RepID=A0A6A3CTW2_HIBSY|nr:equilibrative nucleoside transporter 2-like [Hibiscus syriacus]
MSLRYASRVFYQSGMRAVQLMKDHASKCEPNLRSLKDSASSSSSSSKQARRLSNTVDFKAAAAKKERLKQAEESLRTVMFLSCWGPN